MINSNRGVILEDETINSKKISFNDYTKSEIIPFNLGLKKKKINDIWNRFIIRNPKAFPALLKKIGIQIDYIKKRKCILCENRLTFLGFFQINASLGLGKALEIWQNDSIEFYCPECSGEI
ncbi:MAG: hypothetical protein GF317_00445 [Candidatus Lokiarchaeota archaeon]|nr:hypothetical protein [Candidatus Lokiarchaeota archaeon]MBD3198445.1 hypothetical protein [Candidatus Lokiarchaeota archaeon]